MFDERLVLDLKDTVQQRIVVDKQKTKQRAGLIDVVKQRLGVVSELAVQAFDEEDAQYPDSASSIEQTIEPYWRQIHQSGIIDFINAYYSTGGKHVVADPIDYLTVPYLPRNILSGSKAECDVKPIDFPTIDHPPFEDRVVAEIGEDEMVARNILRQYDLTSREDVDELIDNDWFKSRGNVQVLLNGEGFTFWTGGSDRWRGLHGVRLHFLHPNLNRDDSRSGVSNKVYADFAAQIQNGKVNDYIKKYINREMEGVNPFREKNVYDLSK